MRVFLSVLIGFFSTSLMADEKDNRITWIMNDWAPWQYQKEGKWLGYAVEWQEMVEAELPQYNHKKIEMTFARMLQSLDHMDDVCVIGILRKPEREKYVHYSSIASGILHPNVLFMREETHRKLGSPSKVSLEELLAGNNGVLGLPKSRKYAVLSKIIEQYADKKNIKHFAHSTVLNNLFGMLQNKRVDFIVDWPMEGTYTARQLPPGETIVYVPIEEDSQMAYTYAACSKNEWGRSVLNDIDAVLPTVKPTEKYRRAVESRIDAREIPAFREVYDSEFLKK